MIKNNNVESIRQLVTFIFLFSGIMMCILSPCRVFAAGSMTAGVNIADEKIATFDDEGATPDQEATASSLLHGENYQASAYFPERQKRTMTSHPWMRMIPFAVLVILALTASRFFGRRRPKIILTGNGAVSEKVAGIGVLIFLIALMTGGVAYAKGGGFFGQGGFGDRGGFGQSGVSISTKDGVASLLGDGEIYQKEIEFTSDVKKVLKEKLSWEPQDNSIKVYYSKTKDGTVEAYAFVISEILQRCGGTHKYSIKVSSKGQVEGVKILDLNCHHSYGVNNETFLNQFKSMNTANAGTLHIDGVTRVTLSANLTYWVVRRALVLFDLLKGLSNA